MAGHPLHLSPLLLLAFAPVPAIAQSRDGGEPEQVIVITAQRGVPGVLPERQLEQRDIEGYGVDSIGELIDEIAAENGETDNPIFLVNGRRVSDLSELSDYPAEALERVDVLGPDVGARVGQPAARRAYNLVLQTKFDGRIGRAAAILATEGDWASRRADLSYTRIRDERRLNLRLAFRDEDDLLESDRGVVQPVDSVANAGRFRTLRPDLLDIDLSASAASPLTDWLNFSSTGKIEFVRSQALLGFAEALNGAREQDRRTITGRFDSTLNGQRAGWDLTLLGRYEQNQSQVLVSSEAVLASRDRSSGTGRIADLDFTATRNLLNLPAGPLQLTLGANINADRNVSRFRQGSDRSRNVFSEAAQTVSSGIVIPLSSAGGGLAPIGDLYAAANVGAIRFSSSGYALNRQFSLTWQPTPRLRLFGILSQTGAPPAASLRSGALVVTPGVRYFDPLKNETVEVRETSGGIDTRVRQRSLQHQLGASFSPAGPLNLRFSVDYEYRRDRNLLAALPQASSTILALFPDRFVRDLSGRLVGVDTRPVLFASRTEREVRSTLNLSLPLGGAREERRRSDDAPADDDREERSRSSARLQFNLAHTFLIDSKLDVGTGRPPVDLLSRRALALGGGQSRHQIDGSLGFSMRGLGLRLTGSYRSRYLLELGDEAGAPTALQFGSLTRLNLRAFANADRLFGRKPWTRGSRITLSASNLANVRQEVRSDAGTTPLAFQSAYREPTGRTIEVELRTRL
jgi:hypothetical protein